MTRAGLKDNVLAPLCANASAARDSECLNTRLFKINRHVQQGILSIF